MVLCIYCGKKVECIYEEGNPMTEEMYGYWCKKCKKHFILLSGWDSEQFMADIIGGMNYE